MQDPAKESKPGSVNDSSENLELIKGSQDCRDRQNQDTVRHPTEGLSARRSGVATVQAGDIASGAGRGNFLRGALFSVGGGNGSRALSFEKLVEDSAVALVEPENSPRDKISRQVKNGGRDFQPGTMKRQPEEQSERERRERSDPRFDQGSPRPAPFHQPRDFNPAKDALDQIGRKNP